LIVGGLLECYSVNAAVAYPHLKLVRAACTRPLRRGERRSETARAAATRRACSYERRRRNRTAGWRGTRRFPKLQCPQRCSVLPCSEARTGQKQLLRRRNKVFCPPCCRVTFERAALPGDRGLTQDIRQGTIMLAPLSPTGTHSRAIVSERPRPGSLMNRENGEHGIWLFLDGMPSCQAPNRRNTPRPGRSYA
jgi:hypothetical protein